MAGAKFTRVEEPRLGKGLFWRKDSTGLVWGNTVLDPVSKTDLKKKWQEAKDECLKLNKDAQGNVRVFWSYSVDPHYADYALIFFGGYGTVNRDYHGDDESFTCVCPPQLGENTRGYLSLMAR